jgi:hypothetical protein
MGNDRRGKLTAPASCSRRTCCLFAASLKMKMIRAARIAVAMAGALSRVMLRLVQPKRGWSEDVASEVERCTCGLWGAV